MELLDGLNLHAQRRATKVVDYDLLTQYVRIWASGKGHHTLVIVGRPGILKTSAVRAAFPNAGACLFIDGATGPLALYRDLYLNRNLPVVLDDVKVTEQLWPVLLPLFDNYDLHTLRWAAARRLKVFPPTSAEQTVQQKSTLTVDPSEDVHIDLPTSFSTRSRCCLIANSLHRFSAMGALLDRAYLIDFLPPTSVVLERCRSFVDSAVWCWAKRHEQLLPHLSVRDLVQASIDKKVGMQWEMVLSSRYFDERTNLGAYLAVIRDARLRTGEQRWRRFAELTGRDRSAFYRTQREYRRVFPAPNLPRGRSARR